MRHRAERFESVDPATGEVLAEIEQAGADEIERAVAAAKAGFAVWSRMTGAERARILRRTADILRARNDELAEIETRDTGKPIQETLAVDILSGADCLEYFAGIVRDHRPASRSISAPPPSSIHGASRSASSPASAPGTTRSRSPAGSRLRLSPAAMR